MSPLDVAAGVVVVLILALVVASRRRDERCWRETWEAVRRSEEDARAGALRHLNPRLRRRLTVCSGCDGLIAVMALAEPVMVGLCDCGEVLYREKRT